MEQVRRAADVFLAAIDLPPRLRRQSYQAELKHQHYYQRRNAAASCSHRKTRLQQLHRLGIDPNQIKSVLPEQPPC